MERERNISGRLAGDVYNFYAIRNIRVDFELIFSQYLNYTKMQKKGQKLEGGRGTYILDRTSVVCRDSYGNTYYRGLQEDIGRQGKVCIKEYHRSFSNEDAKFEWSIIDKVQKDNRFFKDRMVVDGQPYLVLTHFDNSLAGFIENGKDIRISHFFNQVSQEIGRCNRANIQGWEFSLDPSCIVVRKEKGSMDIVNFIGRKGRKRNYYYEEPVTLREDRQEEDFSKRNVWEFGCILYEILSGGEKLFQREQLIWKDVFPRQIQVYVRNRFQILRHSLFIQQSKYEQELKIAEESFKRDQTRRPDLSNIDTQFEQRVKQLNSQEDVRASERYFFCSSLFQAKRCNFLYGCIQDTFLLCGRIQPIEKVPIYIALKFAVYFYLQTYQRVKAKAKAKSKDQQIKKLGYNLLKFFQNLDEQYQFFQEQDFIKAIESALSNVKKGRQQLDQMLREFPEWKEYEVLAPQKVFFQFCSRYKSVLCENKEVGRGLYRIMHLTKNYDELSQLKIKNDSMSYREVETRLQELIRDWNYKTNLPETAQLELEWTKVLESLYPKRQGQE